MNYFIIIKNYVVHISIEIILYLCFKVEKKIAADTYVFNYPALVVLKPFILHITQWGDWKDPNSHSEERERAHIELAGLPAFESERAATSKAELDV